MRYFYEKFGGKSPSAGGSASRETIELLGLYQK